MASLTRHGLEPVREWDFGGVQVDVLVQHDDGWTLVIDAKAVQPTGIHVDAAMNQVRLYENSLGAERAMVVFDRLDYSIPEKGIVAWHEFEQLLPRFLGRDNRVLDRANRAVTRARPVNRTIFAAMPFAPEFADTYLVAMSHAAEANGATCVRVDHEDFVGDVVYEIHHLIQESVAV